MTIIKVGSDVKPIVKKKLLDETAEPLAPESTTPTHTVHVEVLPTQRTKRMVNVFLLLIALLVLSAGIVGGVYLFKYMSHRQHKGSRVQVQYDDVEMMPTPVPQHDDPTAYHPKQTAVKKPQTGYLTMVEDIDIEVEEEVERIEVPRFDQCRSSVVIHDFHMNITAIVDNSDKECFIMDLDRAHMSPPKTFAELIRKYSVGYYMPKVDVVRRDYHVLTPPLTDLSFTGGIIAKECQGYSSYKLEKNKRLTPVFEIRFKQVRTYGYSDLKKLMIEHVFF